MSDSSVKILTVKELDPDDQPREKALKYGIQSLSTPDLWALILRTGAQGFPITELCRELMRANDGSLHKLERRSRQEIMELKGIGLTKGIQIEAVLELIKRYCSEDFQADEPITNSNQIYGLMKYKIGNLDHEEVWLLILNRRNIVVRSVRLTSGTSNASLFDVKGAMKHALLENAESLIMCHNHPSGSLRPSPQDDAITKKLKDASEIMGIKMLDHIIVTANGFYSYMDQSRI